MNGSLGAKAPPWDYKSPERTWYGFGRYFAMFPPSFAHDAVCGLTRPGEAVLDPFCGRGNGPYVATVSGRPSLGIDVNPIAWLFTAVKLHPEPKPSQVLARLDGLRRAQRPSDRRARNEFEKMAWAAPVRSVLRAARRELDWRNSVTDRTLMGFVALHMQDKLGAGLSNTLWPTIACSPRYAVDWWTRHGLREPPDVDPIALMRDKIRRRYRFGTPRQAPGVARLGDSRTVLREKWDYRAALLMTSPPYCGVTDYWNDHWIRLWILGYSMKKDWSRSARFGNLGEYRELLVDVLAQSKRHLTEDAVILVRSDTRRRTWRACLDAIRRVWPEEDVSLPWQRRTPQWGVNEPYSARPHGERSRFPCDGNAGASVGAASADSSLWMAWRPNRFRDAPQADRTSACPIDNRSSHRLDEGSCSLLNSLRATDWRDDGYN